MVPTLPSVLLVLSFKYQQSSATLSGYALQISALVRGRLTGLIGMAYRKACLLYACLLPP